ncbi:hypothetical protein [Mycobacterium sp.]|uniref:hypothetical protein n=1 Tax=Mycobacterium sp. TaxID=1785 RepID=UPI0025F5AEA6|nr:hypothetical protein [Mycobacterium sp.]
MDRHGGPLVIVARFPPRRSHGHHNRLQVLDFPYRQFVVFDAVGAVLWATLNTTVGYLGVNAFADNTFVAFAVSFGAALAGIIELIRWIRRRTRRQGQARRQQPRNGAPADSH